MIDKKYELYYRMIYKKFQWKIKKTEETIIEYLKMVKKPYVSFSGGKDSTVMLHLISKIDKTIDVFTEVNDMDFPDKLKICIKIIDCCEIKNYYAGHTERIDKSDGSGWHKCIQDFVMQGGYDGVFLGLRAEESKNRSITIAKKGIIYTCKDNAHSRTFGKVNVITCLPLAFWHAEEVFSYIICNDLPYHSIYEKNDFRKPHEIRFSWTYISSDDESNFLEFGADNIKIYKKYYPKIFTMLEQKYGVSKIRRYL